MDHKKRCEELRRIRVRLADIMGIGDKVKRTPCDFTGECTGTCPACRAEEEMFRKLLVKRAGVTAAAAGVGLTMTACGGISNIKDIGTISGDVQVVEPYDEPLMGEFEEKEPEVKDDDSILRTTGVVPYVNSDKVNDMLDSLTDLPVQIAQYFN